MTINFFNENCEDTKAYEDLISEVFSFIEQDKEFSVVFVNDEKIQEINRTYRSIDRITDVISFALCDDPENELEDELGDIFIDIDQAIRQANAYGHTPAREIAFLAVHGYLHLCGYDHMNKDDEEKMCKKQEEILARAGLSRV